MFQRYESPASPCGHLDRGGVFPFGKLLAQLFAQGNKSLPGDGLFRRFHPILFKHVDVIPNHIGLMNPNGDQEVAVLKLKN